MSTPDQPDWRTLPRKPEASRLSRTVTLRLSESELATLRDLAASAGLPLSRFLVLSGLGKRPK